MRTHFKDPCIHCNIPHGDVTPGPCVGDPGKAIPIAYRSLGARWDNVEQFLIRMSDGRIERNWSHVSERSPYYHFGWAKELCAPPRYDEKLQVEKS